MNFKHTLYCIPLFVACSTSNVWAWGATGHRAVGLIAEQHLQAGALKKAHAILDGYSLAYVATWPDEIRSDPQNYGYTFIWHYTTWPDGIARLSATDETKDSGLLLTTINKQLAILKDPNRSKSDKAFALKFVVHLVGDLHQPLHVGGSNDHGGNMCKVTWHGKVTNLHTVWDSAMIDDTQLSFTELANFVSQGHNERTNAAWLSGDLISWSEESKKIRQQLYPQEVLASETPNSNVNYCQEDVPRAAMPNLGYEYNSTFSPIVYQRLYQAGIRLAKLLNESL